MKYVYEVIYNKNGESSAGVFFDKKPSKSQMKKIAEKYFHVYDEDIGWFFIRRHKVDALSNIAKVSRTQAWKSERFKNFEIN